MKQCSITYIKKEKEDICFLSTRMVRFRIFTDSPGHRSSSHPFYKQPTLFIFSSLIFWSPLTTFGSLICWVTLTTLLLYGTAECRIFHRTPAGHTAERKTRRKRNRGCYGLLSVPRQPYSPPPLPLPPPIPRFCRTACGHVISIS